MIRFFSLSIILLSAWSAAVAAAPRTAVLNPEDFKCHVDYLNSIDSEPFRQHIPNSGAWEFMRENIPFLDCPDPEVMKTYYFRWWTFRKHIKETPAGFIITEFLPPVRWAGVYNSICCPAGHHFYEGRWLKDNRFLNSNARFWLSKGDPRLYSFWVSNALLEYYKVTGDPVVKELLPKLVENYRAWEPMEIRRKKKVGRNPDGLFSMKDTCDGMEFQIGGSGKRPTINSYQYGDAMAIAEIAAMVGDTATESLFREEAHRLKALVQEKLWDRKAGFFKTIREETDSLADVRELQGYTPWYMNLPDDTDEYARAWKWMLRSNGFRAPYGLTTAEQSHPAFMRYRGKKLCHWDGPSWPFATSVTLTAMANLLNNYHQKVIRPQDYVEEFLRYSRAQRITDPKGNTIPWIDEMMDPNTGDWMTRSLRLDRSRVSGEEFVDRGKDYNHSSYCDLLISGLIGVRPQSDNSVVVNPLISAAAWPWFCLDGIPYKGHTLTICYDADGTRYPLGKGFFILVDGTLKASAKKPKRLHIPLSR